jgi:hypothetical protein
MFVLPALCSVLAAMASAEDSVGVPAASLAQTPHRGHVIGIGQNESLPCFWRRPFQHVRMLEAARGLKDLIHISFDIKSPADLDIQAALEVKKNRNARQHGITPDMLSQTGPVTYTNPAGQTKAVTGPGDIQEFPGKLTLSFEIAAKDDMYLMNSYEKVFPTGNRNNGGFVWSNWLLSQSDQLSPERFQKFFAMFCGVSGAPLGPSEGNTGLSRWRLQLKDVTGNTSRSGFMYYCTGCSSWPCMCDAQDFLRVDTKTIVLQGGVKKKYRFVVVGDPCRNEDLLNKPYFEPDQSAEAVIRDVSPEVACDGGRLKHSMLSDNGHVILTMFHEDDAASKAHLQSDYASQCKSRAAHNFMGGMGMIFRKFAGVTPLDAEAEAQAKLAPTKHSAGGGKKSQLFQEHGDNTRVTRDIAAENAAWLLKTVAMMASISMILLLVRWSMPAPYRRPADNVEIESAE